MSEAKQSIVKLIKNKINCKSFRWSRSIGLDVQGTTLVITLASNKAGKNMQHLAACFEGWATILKTYVIDSMPDKYNQVELRCSDLMLPIESSTANRHLMRFLYRVLRFKEQYDWFTMDDKLANIIDSFNRRFKGCFVNNYSEEEQKQKDQSESEIEHLLIKKNTSNDVKSLYSYFNAIGIPNDGLVIDHQFKVGLFNDSIADINKVFPGGSAAIDLWGFTQSQPNDLYLFELKYQNEMIGTITEVFFYANYLYDLLDKNGVFTLSKGDGKNIGNYNTILGFNDKKVNKIHAVMLLDKDSMHPAITPELIAVLNKGNQKAIEYSLAGYEFDEENRIVTDISPR